MPSALQQAIMVLAVLAGGCAAGPSPPPADTLTAGEGLTPRDNIDGLDVAIDAAGGVHVAWQERLGEYGEMRGTRLVYRRGTGAPLRWEPPAVLGGGQAETGNPQIVATGSGVHVFAGAHLHHWWLPAGGGAAEDLGETVGVDGPEVGGFDAAASGDGVLIVYAMPDQAADEAIHAVRWTPAGPQAPVRIAASARAYAARPRLLRLADRWIAFWGNNAFVNHRDPADGLMVAGVQSDLRAAVSLDEGAHWEGPVRVASTGSDVVGIAAAAVAAEPVVLFASNGLYESRLHAGRWTPPRRLAAYRRSFFSGSEETSSVAAIRCNGHTMMAWVDARHRRSDRRWWNPLGGFPWGDDPDWDNNDLFVATDAVWTSGSAAAPAPLRLTADGSMTTDIALVADAGRLLVFRSGRAQVRKAPYDAGAPPEVTVSSIPCG